MAPAVDLPTPGRDLSKSKLEGMEQLNCSFSNLADLKIFLPLE